LRVVWVDVADDWAAVIAFRRAPTEAEDVAEIRDRNSGSVVRRLLTSVVRLSAIERRRGSSMSRSDLNNALKALVVVAGASVN